MHYFLFGKGVVSEFSYSLDNREDTNLTLLDVFQNGEGGDCKSLVKACKFDSYHIHQILLVIHLSLFCYLLRNFDS